MDEDTAVDAEVAPDKRGGDNGGEQGGEGVRGNVNLRVGFVEEVVAWLLR